MTEAEHLLSEVEERIAELDTAIRDAPNARSRSPLRKELWWARQLEGLLVRWITTEREQYARMSRARGR